MPYLKDNYCDPKIFELACAIMKYKYPKCKFEIKKTYLDYGARMTWENIIATNPDSPSSDGFQLLSPREWDDLIICENEIEIAKLMSKVASGETTMRLLADKEKK